MEAKAYLKYLRIAPRKVQISCDLIRGKDVSAAAAILMNSPQGRQRAAFEAFAFGHGQCGE